MGPGTDISTLHHAVSTTFNNAEARYLYRFPEHRDHLIFDERDVQAEMTMAMGSALHAVVQTQFQMAGILRPEKNVEVDYLIEEHHVRGRIDMIVDHPIGGPLIVELKTINSRSFDSQTKPKPEWEAQLSLALHAYGHPYGVLLALESGWPADSGNLEFLVTMNCFPRSSPGSTTSGSRSLFDRPGTVLRPGVGADDQMSGEDVVLVLPGSSAKTWSLK